MVLSCFDLLTVVTNNPALLIFLMSSLMEDYNLLPMLATYVHVSGVFLAFPFFTLLVMSIERYLGVYYPIFHYTSVTRRRLLTLLAILLILTTVMLTISRGDLVISSSLIILILMALFLPPFIFVNFKLFVIARKVHRERAIPENKDPKDVERLYFRILNENFVVFIKGHKSYLEHLSASDRAKRTIGKYLKNLALQSVGVMNRTSNSFIFFWKNEVLRTEGIKMVKTLKDRLVGS